MNRIYKELDILRNSYPQLEYVAEGQWIRIPGYPLPPGWDQNHIDVVSQIPAGYPGGKPYGIYVPAGLKYQGQAPKNYVEPAKNHPPFKGVWGVLSWQPKEWHPKAEITAGSNLWTWVRSFYKRFQEGR